MYAPARRGFCTHEQLWSFHRQGKLIAAFAKHPCTHHHHRHDHDYHHAHLHQYQHHHYLVHVHLHAHSPAMHHRLNLRSNTMQSTPFESFATSRRRWQISDSCVFRHSATASPPRGRTYQYPECGSYCANAPFYGSSLAKIPKPIQQPDEACLSANDSMEERLDSLLGRDEMMVTRDIEWANVVVGYRQEHRYVLTDLQDKSAVIGFIVEKSQWLFRQFLRSRCPFTAIITDKAGRFLFMLRRPVWFYKSTIFAEIDGKVIGFVRSRWHPWRRICDIYLGKKQFASMENPGFWNWTFVVKDETGQMLTLIDRDYRNWGYETLTDASQYIVRFGKAAAADGVASQRISPEKATKYDLEDDDNDDDDDDNIVFTIDQKLTLNERACILALLVSLDNDYFSRHSGGAWLIPIPFFMGGGGQ